MKTKKATLKKTKITKQTLQILQPLASTCIPFPPNVRIKKIGQGK